MIKTIKQKSVDHDKIFIRADKDKKVIATDKKGYAENIKFFNNL